MEILQDFLSPLLQLQEIGKYLIAAITLFWIVVALYAVRYKPANLEEELLISRSRRVRRGAAGVILIGLISIVLVFLLR